MVQLGKTRSCSHGHGPQPLAAEVFEQDQHGVFSISPCFCAAFPSSLNFGRWVPLTNSLMEEVERDKGPLAEFSLVSLLVILLHQIFMALESREVFE